MIAIIAILAEMLLPALNKAKTKAKGTACTSNLHHMALAWQQYTLDDNDVMPPSMTRGSNIPEESYPVSWVLGNAQLDTDTTNIQCGVLYRYTGNPAIYRCPADSSVVSRHPGLLRMRSYSMNWWLNGDRDEDDNPSSMPEDKTKLSQVMAPAQIFVLADENESSINDGSLVVFSEKYASPDVWQDLPSDRHNQSCKFFFADGHAQPHKWSWPKIAFKVVADIIKETVGPVGINGPRERPGKPNFVWPKINLICTSIQPHRSFGLEVKPHPANSGALRVCKRCPRTSSFVT